MPNYEYKCTQDGSRFEVWQEVGTPAPPCPACGAPSKKVFQAPRVHFKGSGFYLTDLRAEQSGGKNGGKATSAESDSGSDATTATATATDSKADAKVEKTEVKGASTPTSSPTSGATGAKTE